MNKNIHFVLQNLINDAASGNSLLYITDEFNENILSVAAATDMTVFCEDLDLLSKYRRLFKNCKGVVFAKSRDELTKNYETVAFFCSLCVCDGFSEIIKSAKQVIIPNDKADTAEKCLSRFENKTTYQLSMNGSFAELSVSTDSVSDLIAVYYNGEAVTKDFYEASKGERK